MGIHTTGIIQTSQAFFIYTNTSYNIHGAFPLLFLSPCWFPFVSPCSPYCPFPLTWNPPCCDRIRPPLSWVARKLTPSFPSPAHLAPHPKSRPPGVFPDPNRHSLGRHCEPNPYARLHLTNGNASTHFRHAPIIWNLKQYFLFVFWLIYIYKKF